MAKNELNKSMEKSTYVRLDTIEYQSPMIFEENASDESWWASHRFVHPLRDARAVHSLGPNAAIAGGP